MSGHYETAKLMRDAAMVERDSGRTGHTREVFDEVLRALPRGDREEFAAEQAVYLARALVAATARQKAHQRPRAPEEVVEAVAAHKRRHGAQREGGEVHADRYQ